MNARRLWLVGAGLLSISALMPPAHGAEGPLKTASLS